MRSNFRITEEFLKTAMHKGKFNRTQKGIITQTYPLLKDMEDKDAYTVLNRMTLPKEDAISMILLSGDFDEKTQHKIYQNFNEAKKILSEKKVKEEKSKVEIMKEKEGGILIYTDGACMNTPGPSGSGIAIYEKDKDMPAVLFGDYNEEGTSNSAELQAIYKALTIAEECLSDTVVIYSASQYAINSVTVWAYAWKRNDWKKKNEEEIKNLILIKKTHALYDRIKGKVDIMHIKVNSGIEGNDIAYRMALFAIKKKAKDYQEFIYRDKEFLLGIGKKK